MVCFLRTNAPSEAQFNIKSLQSHAKTEDISIDDRKSEIDSSSPQDEIENLSHLELEARNQALQEDGIVED